jgi:ABC-type uncharacterized transport system permease subunit
MENDSESVIEVIQRVIENHIGWAKTKDIETLYSTCLQSDDFFIFHPDAESTIHGFQDFTQMVESLFLRSEFKAIRFELKDLRISLSRSKDVAWFSCLLDDINEFKGKPVEWHDVRWTGVLEKVDSWKIVQEHFSKAS